jgi:Domain of unknown function (DUF4494)
MIDWFECKVRYAKIDEKSGKEKTVTESYLVDAVSFTDAEDRIFKEMQAVISDNFKVVAIKRVNYTDLFKDGTGDRFYKARVSFMALEEGTGREMKVVNNMLILAESVEDANVKLALGLKEIGINYEVVGITESAIVDVYVYD